MHHSQIAERRTEMRHRGRVDKRHVEPSTESSSAEMIETPETETPSPTPALVADTDCIPAGGQHLGRARGLVAIGLFKLAKALFFFVVGMGALHLVHSNLGEVLLRVITKLHFAPDAPFIEKLLDRADLISGHQLRQLSLATFGYACLSLVEGIGLMMEQTWAEYLTLTLTTGALPWEVYELFKHGTAIRAGLLLVNLAVLAYLLWFIRWHRRQMRLRRCG